VPVSPTGHVSVFTPTATKVIVRVRGYYTISPYTDDGGTFTPVAPATVVDNLSLPAGGRPRSPSRAWAPSPGRPRCRPSPST
jgi:hypothetical protein